MMLTAANKERKQI